MFCSTASTLSHHLYKEIEVAKLVTPAFILSHLTATLQHHIQYSCPIRKFGTLLFRPGSNLIKPLTQALWKLRNNQQKHTPNSISGHYAVLDDLNHRACSHILSQNRKDNFELSDTSIKNLIAEIDPTLWEAICTLTMSPAEKKESATITSRTEHTKLMRRFYIFCCMMFCIND